MNEASTRNAIPSPLPRGPIGRSARNGLNRNGTTNPVDPFRGDDGPARIHEFRKRLMKRPALMIYLSTVTILWTLSFATYGFASVNLI